MEMGDSRRPKYIGESINRLLRPVHVGREQVPEIIGRTAIMIKRAMSGTAPLVPPLCYMRGQLQCTKIEMAG